MSHELRRDVRSILIGLVVAAAVVYGQHNDPLASETAFVQRLATDGDFVAREAHLMKLEFGRIYAALTGVFKLD